METYSVLNLDSVDQNLSHKNLPLERSINNSSDKSSILSQPADQVDFQDAPHKSLALEDIPYTFLESLVFDSVPHESLPLKKDEASEPVKSEVLNHSMMDPINSRKEVVVEETGLAPAPTKS